MARMITKVWSVNFLIFYLYIQGMYKVSDNNIYKNKWIEIWNEIKDVLSHKALAISSACKINQESKSQRKSWYTT